MNTFLRILLLRHGQTASNAGNMIQGHLPVPLNDLGIAQATALASRLAREEKIDVLISSDLLRAMQTAEPISRAIGLTIIPDPRWRERFLGSMQGKSFTQQDIWRLASGHIDCADAEPVNQMEDRIAHALESLRQDHPKAKTIAIVTHGGPLRLIGRMLRSGRLPTAPGTTIEAFDEIANCAINELVRSDGRWNLVRVNDAAHLSAVTKRDIG